MFDLKVFQTESARLMADRFAFYSTHPHRPKKGDKTRPFYQALSAITGAGKTPILAQAVAYMRLHLHAEPIVLWMSKAKSVVAQTYTNFSEGGKYREIIGDFRVVNIQDVSPALIADGTSPLLVMTTTGLFNNRDQAEGALNIYKRDKDASGEKSRWERLIERTDEGKRRPLIVVYDEGHNLSEQQTDILAELEPDAYLLASATLKLPANFAESVLSQIKIWVKENRDSEAFVRLKAVNEHGLVEAERFVTTTVISERVVTAQLIKKAVQFDGTTAPMERCVDDLIQRMDLIQSEIEARNLGFKPKAIYVCKTNIADDGDKDDGSMPFMLRKAPPIRIWRYLVEEKGISPKDIAIYANLNFQEKNKPDEVNLFSKGENDFDEFQAGNYQHIIFNLSLQEGWDDPACYLAYIDKSMESSMQVSQVMGRVLRQYDATHYENPLLNSAHFFLRVDKQSVFTEAINSVKAKLQDEGTPIEISDNYSEKGTQAVDDLEPKAEADVALHHIFVESSVAKERIAEIVKDFTVFSEGDVDNTMATAHAASYLLDVLDPEKDNSGLEWKADGNTNPVRLRWLVNTAIKARAVRVLSAVDLQHKKFDVRVQIQSRADKQAELLARDIVSTYFALSELSYESAEPFNFGTMRVPRKAHAFQNGLYERYSGFNRFELTFAEALDGAGVWWHRNPSAGGFHIPLLSEGDTAEFYPDFIAWSKGKIFCLDTKGGHLLSDAVARKLFDIQEDDKTRLHVRFITEGKQTELLGKAIKGGYTVWKLKLGAVTPLHFDDLDKAVKECLR